MRTAPAERGLPALQAVKVSFWKFFCRWLRQQQQRWGGLSDVQTQHTKPEGAEEMAHLLKLAPRALCVLLLSPSGGLLVTQRLCMG